MSSPTGPVFALRFYQQSAAAILAVVESAQRSHPGIVGWTQVTDVAAPRPCTTVTLQFRDRESFEPFAKDEQFVAIYLASAWGRRALGREALRVHASSEAECDTVPGDLFAEVSI